VLAAAGPPPAVGHSTSPSPSRSLRHVVVVVDHDEGLERGVVHVDGVFVRGKSGVRTAIAGNDSRLKFFGDERS
jgi:hypothetical protein